MRKKKYCLTVKGKEHKWTFIVMGKPEYVRDWQEDGLEVDQLVSAIPEWWVRWGLPVWVYVWLFEEL